jgi:CheY-like chemotaxis protein
MPESAMAFKRALVVDDSRLARVALKKLLEEHDLDVAFAASGEEALKFLDAELVDVVFMDHHMPGMDGLEAVAAIKRNPRTATIPVMMYTTREGEVYVSQARALGAVGVLPKQVQPNVLFDMLMELGLVQDRRTISSDAPGEGGSASEADHRLDDQARGVSLQSIVMRILEDQHLTLRADILRGNRAFARQVASEILEEARAADELSEREEPSARNYSQGVVTLVVLFLLFSALVLGGLYLQSADELDAARVSLADLDRTLDERLQVAENVTSTMLVEMRQERGSTQQKHLAGLAWSLNEGGYHEFDHLAFNAERLDQVLTVIAHLEDLGFEGTVRLTSHLGEFCLIADRLGTLTLAAPDIDKETCTTIGHPLDGSSFPGERMSAEFESYLAARSESDNAIELELIARDRFGSTRRVPFPSEAVLAGEWNEVATRNHRVEYEFLTSPDGQR